MGSTWIQAGITLISRKTASRDQIMTDSYTSMFDDYIELAVKPGTPVELLYGCMLEIRLKKEVLAKLNHPQRSYETMVRVKEFVQFLRTKLGSDTADAPASWVVHSFGYDLDTSDRYYTAEMRAADNSSVSEAVL